jgi:hypothetical protein
MAQHRERRWPWIVAGYALLLAIVAAVTSFLYDTVAPANQPIAVRLAVALVVGVVLLHLRAHFRSDPRWEPPSAFEDALNAPAPPPKLNAAFVKLREEVVNGAASRSYFDKILWPRLAALARARGQEIEMPPSADRRWPDRGPSRRAIAALIERLERPEAGE